MQYIIRGKSFVFTTEIRDNTTLRKSFFSLARQTFDLDFEPWYQCGGWQDRYLPHALVCGEQVAANVSVNRMDFQLDGRRRTYLQLGTVMTHPDYRGMGLSRFLMEWILQNWSDRCDGIYLFANDTVLDFYPKFGFLPAEEAQVFFPSSPQQPIPLRRINPDNPKDRALLIQSYRRSNPFSAFSMENNEGLLLFYALGPFRHFLYTPPEENAVAILEEDGDTLFCHELLGEWSGSLFQTLNRLTQPHIRKIGLGFTPKDTLPGQIWQPGEDHLFVLGKKENPFAARKLFFPLISHA
jgi:GNAT superfamily N-acetyltransferase